MAAKTTFGLALKNNAAKDDAFSGTSIDWLTEGGGLMGSLSVLDNDPGSATLYALHGAKPDGEGQMDESDAAQFTVSYGGVDYFGDLTANPDGTVEFDLSELDGVLDLAEGETLEVTFFYTAQMGKGALSTAEVKVEITGVGEAGEPVPPDGGGGAPPAPIPNGGFEDGDFTGWTASGSALVTDQLDFEGTLVTAQEGSYMAVLSTDPTAAGSPTSSADLESFVGVSAGSLTGIGIGTAIEGSAIQATVFLSAGQMLSFDYFFDTQEVGSFHLNDFAFFTVAPSTASEIVDADFVQPGGDSGSWKTYTFMAPADGDYAIGIGVADVEDNMITSLLYVDNFQIA